MANWKEVYSEPCKTSDVELFDKLINKEKPLIFFPKSFGLDIWQDSEYASATWRENYKFYYTLQFEITVSWLLATVSSHNQKVFLGNKLS